jgi:hypothetical protein
MTVRITSLEPRFVEFVPRELEEGVLYISERFQTASHLCACGCGERVVTPLTPVDWQLKVEGKTVSLYPSIGNWNYACQSHYWIRRNAIVWAAPMSKQQIERVQRRDLADKAAYVARNNVKSKPELQTQGRSGSHGPVMHAILWLRKWLGL